MLGNAILQTLTNGSGQGGNIQLKGNNTALLINTILASDALSSDGGTSGTGGSISVTAFQLILDNSVISAGSKGLSRGGNIRLDGNNITLLNQTALITSAFSNGIEMSNGAAGNIEIVAANNLHTLDSSITAGSEFSNGGNIHLMIGNTVDLQNSHIAATAVSGTGTGGNIVIDPRLVVLKRSDISADARGGPGGNVTIIANNFFASPDSKITASSALSTPGTVDIQAPLTDLSGSLTSLPGNIAEATSFLRQSCASRYSSGKTSSLASSGRGGTPFEPGGFLMSPLTPFTDSSLAQGGSESASFMASARPKFSIAQPCEKLY